MYTVTLKFETLDGVREQMIEYHARHERVARREEAETKTQKRKEYYRGYANAHNQMVEFWQTLRLEPIVPADEAA